MEGKVIEAAPRAVGVNAFGCAPTANPCHVAHRGCGIARPPTALWRRLNSPIIRPKHKTS
jgi:hypothetical protein